MQDKLPFNLNSLNSASSSQTSSNQNLTDQSNFKTEEDINDITKWKTTEFYGYQGQDVLIIKYPQTFTVVTPEFNGDINMFYFFDNQERGFSLHIEQAFLDYDKDIQNLLKLSVGETYQGKIRLEDLISPDFTVLQFQEIKCPADPDSCPEKYTYRHLLLKGSKDYYHLFASNMKKSENVELLLKIVNNLKLEQVDFTKDWKILRDDKYRYEFKYPPRFTETSESSLQGYVSYSMHELIDNITGDLLRIGVRGPTMGKVPGNKYEPKIYSQYGTIGYELGSNSNGFLVVFLSNNNSVAVDVDCTIHDIQKEFSVKSGKSCLPIFYSFRFL